MQVEGIIIQSPKEQVWIVGSSTSGLSGSLGVSISFELPPVSLFAGPSSFSQAITVVAKMKLKIITKNTMKTVFFII